MERYDYLQAVTEDVIAFIKDEMPSEHFNDSREDLTEYLHDTLWIDDSVTGNASGSYYCNAWKAEEALAHNWDLLAEALAEFGQDGIDILCRGAEAMDVTIRCYVLAEAIENAIDEMDVEFGF